jgi:formylglycine-generating enzyme required for sulfatase activity
MGNTVNRNDFWFAAILGLATVMLPAPARAQNETAFFRIVSPTRTVITGLSNDGMLTWSNAAMGVTGWVQRATTLGGISNWVNYASYTVTNTVMVGRIFAQPDYLVIDLSGGSNATSYPVQHLSGVPANGWTDEYKTSKLVMRRIAAGTFTMGCPTNELGRYDGETQHQATLTKDFYIGVFEVTQRQWELVSGTKPSFFKNTNYYASRPVEEVSYYRIRENPDNTHDPVVNWPTNSNVNAGSFMGRLRARSGLATLDLPTEAQWEYACRAGTTTALNSGKDLTDRYNCPNMAEVGRYWYNGGNGGFTSNPGTNFGTAQVGSFLPNAWGLYDMHGNVWEWCLDWWGVYPGTVIDPVGPPDGGVLDPVRLARGGSWYDLALDCRSARRGNIFPYSSRTYVGFRAAMTLP